MKRKKIAIVLAAMSLMLMTGCGAQKEKLKADTPVEKEFSEVSSEYQIRISHLDGKDTMRIYVETNGTVDFLDLAKRIAATVKSRIGFTPLVKVVEIGLLPRSEKKTKRVIDERYE